ncbi:MAG: hypothetical protein CMA62_00150 [Euryarchaeota archaeon]|nr:hypothetical protein [Euryarchaeota archaeon]|tara:strand:- start:56 stop:1084 length:1029 start_codon:yes stop_codon:yes gene_type:complete
MFDRIKSTPAKICLIVSALVTIVYSMNFMLFADCYVTGGDGCFTLGFTNETTAGMLSYGNGGPETAFNGVLMFGVFMSTMLILNEGAKGMWKIMIPVIIGFVVMSAAMWAYWGDLDSSTTPKYIAPVTTAIYIAAYFLLKAEDEVDDGISEFKMGLNIDDKPSLVAMMLVVVMGIWYSFMSLVMPEDRIEAFGLGEASQEILDAGLGAPSTVTVAVSGSLFLVYTIWTAMVVLDGAKGKWSILHPGIFFLITATISTYMGLVDNVGEISRPVSDQSVLDSVAGPLAMLLVLFAYYRMRDEGVEDGMTGYGVGMEELAPNAFNVFVITVTLIIGLVFTANVMM